MKTTFKIVLLCIFFALVITPDKICNHLGFGKEKFHPKVESNVDTLESMAIIDRSDYFVNDTILEWSDIYFDFQAVQEPSAFVPKLYGNYQPDLTSEVIELDWKTLIDIQFKLRYFGSLDMELYGPIFSEEVEDLNGKKVTIDGHVIPFDDESDLFALSSFPYASCFFCGRASPASILSMQMKDEGESYKLDAFKKFTGTLYLNYDDPDEFCYVLRDAEEL